jgi:FAD:protein FMN transferase
VSEKKTNSLQPARKIALTHITHRAMATDFVLILPPHAPPRAVDAGLGILERLDAMEAAWTIHSPHSEISQVNRFAGKKAIRVSQSTLALVRRAIDWARRTGGCMDISAGPLVDAWGFTTRSGRKPTDTEIQAAHALVGFKLIEVDDVASTIYLPKPGMKLNLGSIGKGEALDQLAAAMKHLELTDFLIHGGNSSMIAAGDESPLGDNEEHSGQGWCVGLSHPTKPKHTLGQTWLKDSCLGTSGSGKQFFHDRGKRYSHVIDPRTGRPGSDLLSVTVRMDNAADADALATGLFVMGSQSVRSLADSPPDWMPPVIAVSPAARQDDVDVECYGQIELQTSPIKQ